MPTLPEPYARLSHLGADAIPENGGTPGDDTHILAGSYRNAPHAETFWVQNRAKVTDPPEYE